MRFFLAASLLSFLLSPISLYANKSVNVYVWGGEIPRSIIHQFEKDTGIKVNFSTYDSNETMYAKLKASRKPLYDVIMPSGYFVERMKKQGMLQHLDQTQLPNLINVSPAFTKSDFDPGNHYSVPIHWGITGIFYNSQWINDAPSSWSELWENRWRKQLLMLNDAREVFSIALMSLNYSPNDTNPQHIKEAYQALLKLAPNIKLFGSDNLQAVMIDEDALIGAAWNGDAFKAHRENKAIEFAYPKEGFVIWVDCLAIPTNPPHLKEAYEFINYMLKPNIAAQITMLEGHAITNEKGKALLPQSLRNNPMLYPSQEILKRGYFQRDVDIQAISLYNHYWQKLKLSF